MSAPMFSFKWYLYKVVLPFIGLVGICVINSFLFKIFGFGWRGYLELYVKAGPFIALALVAFGAAWETLDNNPGMVSSNPSDYISACKRLAGLPFFAFGGHLISYGKQLSSGQYHRFNLWDLIVGVPLIGCFVLASYAWLWFVAPLQYFLFLVCGAPSRIAMYSQYRLHADRHGDAFKYYELKPDAEQPKTGWDASIRNKPVTMANAYGAAVLLIIGQTLAK